MVKRENIGSHLFKIQLALLNKTMMNVVDDDKWRQWEMPMSLYNEFKAYSIPLIKKVFKCRKSKAEKIFEWFFLEFGVKLTNHKNGNSRLL